MLDILNTLFGGQQPAPQQGLTMADAMQGWGQPQQQQQPDPGDVPLTGHPSMWPGQIQTALGAKPADTGGMAQDILSGRFQSPAPSWDDIYKSGQDSLNGKATTAQDYADEGLKNSMGLLGEIAKMQYLTSGGGRGGAGGGSVFAQTMAVINADPVLAGLPQIEKIRLAQKGMGQNLTYDAQGNVVDMTGAAAGLGNLAHGEKQGGTLGTKQVELQYNPAIAGGEANARLTQEQNHAAPIASQTAQGKAGGEAIGQNIKKAINAPNVINLIGQAKGLLADASGGGASAVVAGGKQFVGMSDKKTQANAKLDLISAGLLNTVPRMEGPQSDADRISYEKASADVGNRKKPTGDRLAALQIMESIQNKYLSLNGIDASGGGQPSPAASDPLGIR